MVPSAPTATPCGSPGSSHRLMIFLSDVATGVSGCAWSDPAIASSAIAANLVVDRIRKLLDDGVGEETLAHVTQLTFDLFPRLAGVCKRDAKQLAGAHIFHAFEAERADRVLNRFSLRVENGRLELDDDGRVHGRGFYRKAECRRQGDSSDRSRVRFLRSDSCSIGFGVSSNFGMPRKRASFNRKRNASMPISP